MNSNVNKNKKSSNNNNNNDNNSAISVEDFQKLQRKEIQLTTDLNWNREQLQ